LLCNVIVIADPPPTLTDAGANDRGFTVGAAMRPGLPLTVNVALAGKPGNAFALVTGSV
jgi:hypothetical protein